VEVLFEGSFVRRHEVEVEVRVSFVLTCRCNPYRGCSLFVAFVVFLFLLPFLYAAPPHSLKEPTKREKHSERQFPRGYKAQSD
jgi:hypothetical protein